MRSRSELQEDAEPQSCAAAEFHLFNGQDARRHSAPSSSSADHCLLTSAHPPPPAPPTPQAPADLRREAEGDARPSFKGTYMCASACLETRKLMKKKEKKEEEEEEGEGRGCG